MLIDFIDYELSHIFLNLYPCKYQRGDMQNFLVFQKVLTLISLFHTILAKLYVHFV